MSTNFLSKKVIIVVAVLTVGVLSAVLAVSSIAQAAAQQQQQQQKMMWWSGQGMPKINGSVSVANEASNFINENVKVSFVAAAQTAQRQVVNGTVVGGHLGVVQGYLAYTFFVADTSNQTAHLVVVDAGNGNVLYTSEGQSLGFFGHPMFGPWSGHGFGGWHGAGMAQHWLNQRLSP